jgi:asparagine synthase (glutamine-hydrolysing)
VGEKVHKFASLLQSHREVDLYRSLLSAWQDPCAVMRIQGREKDHVDRGFEATEGWGLLSRMQYTDQLGYLPDDLLAKVDRVSMAVSLEVRVPLIDHEVVEYSWRLPEDWKIRDRISKWVLREILYRHVPQALIDRPKTGFTAPVAEWLRGPLREWAEDLLCADGLATFPLLDGAEIRRAWQAFLRGRGELASNVWTVLMFRTWYDRWVG